MLEPWKMEPIGRIIKEYVPWLKKKCTKNARLLVLPVRNFNIRQDNICGIWQGIWDAYSSAKTEIAIGALSYYLANMGREGPEIKTHFRDESAF